MDEKKYSINWLSLFIKVIVFVVIVLLTIWLVSKIIRKDDGLSFEEIQKAFQEASVEYFSKNLPEEGKISTVTLNQLISWNYLDELKDEDVKSCDTKNSKSKIELVEDYYSIKSELICGDKSETTYIKVGNEECANCDVKVEDLVIKKSEEKTTVEENINNEVNSTTESSKGPSVSNVDTTSGGKESSTIKEDTTSNQTILYEYVKEVEQYSRWYTGKVTGNNIENSTKTVSYSKFCKIGNLSNCITDETDNSSKYNSYKIVDTWNQTIDIYRYKITVSEYKYSNATSLEGYTKTGNTKIAS